MRAWPRWRKARHETDNHLIRTRSHHRADATVPSTNRNLPPNLDLLTQELIAKAAAPLHLIRQGWRS